MAGWTACLRGQTYLSLNPFAHPKTQPGFTCVHLPTASLHSGTRSMVPWAGMRCEAQRRGCCTFALPVGRRMLAHVCGGLGGGNRATLLQRWCSGCAFTV